MIYPLTPRATKLDAYAWANNVFSDDELNTLKEIAVNAQMAAQVGGNNGPEVNKDVRRSDISWLGHEPKYSWLFERMGDIASDLNSRFYGFDLAGFGEPFQLTNYKQDDSGMYGWHQDFNAGISRKLSMVVQLTDPSEYEGGNLQIANGSSPITVEKRRGLVVVFPAFSLHQVTPVTKGSRQSLVAWVSGAPFK